jgi:hypothetical protein
MDPATKKYNRRRNASTIHDGTLSQPPEEQNHESGGNKASRQKAMEEFVTVTAL